METPTRQTFVAAMYALPGADRRLLELYAERDATAERVGAVLGITAVEARINLFHARRGIRRELAERLRLSA